MFKFITDLFAAPKSNAVPKTSLTLDRMEDRDAPALLAYIPPVQSVAPPTPGATAAVVTIESPATTHGIVSHY